MIGAILAGGYGKRLLPLTTNIPKVLLEIKENYTILDKQILDMKNAGIKSVYLLTGYKGEMIEHRFKNSYKGMKINYFKEEIPMGNLWAIRNLYDHINDDILLRNGDTICDVDFDELFKFSNKYQKILTLVTVKMKSPYGIIKFNRANITQFQEKPILNYYMNAGYYLIKKEISAYLKRSYSDTDIEKTVFQDLVKDGQAVAYKHSGYWASLDSIKDYEDITKFYKNVKDTDFGYIIYEQNAQMLKILKAIIYSGRDMKIIYKMSGVVEKGVIKINDQVFKTGDQFKVKSEDIIHAIKHTSLNFTLT
jgi:NDP-sugar pyrophosphorylase family protein